MNEREERINIAVRRELAKKKKEFDDKFYRFGFWAFFAGFMVLAIANNLIEEYSEERYLKQYLYAANETCKFYLNDLDYDVQAGFVFCDGARECELSCMTKIKGSG